MKILTTENTKVTKIYGYRDKSNHYNALVEVKPYKRPMRGRSEILIIKGNDVYLGLTQAGYKIPGGSWEENESHITAAIREAQEEARITAKDVQYYTTYIKTMRKVREWTINKMPKNLQWNSYYTKVYVGQYQERFRGKIEEDDRDILEEIGEFYSIAYVWDILWEPHKEAIRQYVKDYKLDIVLPKEQ